MDLFGLSVTILALLVIAPAAALAALLIRRRELAKLAQGLAARREANDRGDARAALQIPQIDLSRCLGCGSCVRACPEDGVLDLLHGQAAVVHGARCMGHGRCAQECPVGAIAVTTADLRTRDDIPAVLPSLEAAGAPGIFLAGEVTGRALVRTAVTHGVAVAGEVSRRVRAAGAAAAGDAVDLCIIGAGPAGIACALEAKKRGLNYRVLEQESLGGTVARYPRRKLIMTQPIELPLHGRLEGRAYSKEELMELWHSIAEKQHLDIRTGEEFQGVQADGAGGFVVATNRSRTRARFVCIAIGRRGTPRKLGVEGEDLAKVSYSLLDARSYRGRRILVVGGGDSAVEAALALAEQEGNEVSISYRRSEFTRLRPRNDARLREAAAAGHVKLIMSSEVAAIRADRVDLKVGVAGGAAAIPNDDVFVMIGGTAPFDRLRACGVSFNHGDAPAQAPLAPRTAGLFPAATIVLSIAASALAWTYSYAEYYQMPAAERAASEWHAMLRPSGSIGLLFGAASAGMVVGNLLYLVRRAGLRWFQFGSLQIWMTLHVATGFLALLTAGLHSAFAPHATVGSHALAAMMILIVTGVVGRYFYAYVPRAANGRELAAEEVRAAMAGLSSEWDRSDTGFGERVRAEIEALADSQRWQKSFLLRVAALIGSQGRLYASLTRLRAQGLREGLDARQIAQVLDLARRGHRAALMAAHYEDLRAILATWRFMHRWGALALVALTTLHIFTALRYGAVLGSEAP